MKAYLKINGIKGECTDKDHKDWINVQGFHHGLSQRMFGNAQGREQHGTGQADVRDFVVTKELDASSPNLNLYCAQSKKIDDVTLEIITKDNDKNHKTMTVQLKDVRISSVQVSGQADGQLALPQETISFRFGKISWDYQPIKGGSVKSEFDVKQNA